MAHPSDGLRLHAGKERAGHIEIDRNATVFALGGTFNRSAEGVCRQLHAVADAQNGNALLIDGGVDMRRVCIEYGSRTAGQDDAYRLFVKNFGKRRQKGNDFAENLGFTHAACNQLGILRAEVHQNNSLHILHRMRYLLWLSRKNKPSAKGRMPYLLFYTVFHMKSREAGKKFAHLALFGRFAEGKRTVCALFNRAVPWYNRVTLLFVKRRRDCA